MGDLTDAERAVYEELGRGEGWREALALILAEMRQEARESRHETQELRQDVRGLPCRTGMLPPACPATPAPEYPRQLPHERREKHPSEENPTRREMEDSQRIVLSEAQKTATQAAREALEERLTIIEKKQQEQEQQARARWEWRLSMAQKLVALAVALAAGLGLGVSLKCNPARSEQAHKVTARPSEAGMAQQ